MPGRMRQAFAAGTKLDDQGQPRAHRVRKPDETKASDLDQARNFTRRRRHSVRDLDPIIGDEGKTIIEKAEQKV